MNGQGVFFVCPHCWEEIEGMIGFSMPTNIAQLRLITIDCPNCNGPLAFSPRSLLQNGPVKRIRVCGYHYWPNGQIVLEDEEMASALHYHYEQVKPNFDIADVAINSPKHPISEQEARQFAWDLKHLFKPGGIPLNRL